MRRSRFLYGGFGAMIAAALPPMPAFALGNDVLEYTLTAAPLRFSPVAGVELAGLAFNGTIPGPVLRVRHGQRLRAKFVNQSGEPATIHWHGMILPNNMDGVEALRKPRFRRAGRTYTSTRRTRRGRAGITIISATVSRAGSSV